MCRAIHCRRRAERVKGELLRGGREGGWWGKEGQSEEGAWPEIDASA